MSHSKKNISSTREI